MAVTSTNRLAGPYTGNGVATSFPFTFSVFSATDVSVLIQDLNGNVTVLTLGANYTVAVNAVQDDTPGGTVTLALPLTTGYRLALTTAIPELQQVVLTNLGGFYPQVLNIALDRLTVLCQQLQTGIDRSIKFGFTDDLDSAILQVPRTMPLSSMHTLPWHR